MMEPAKKKFFNKLIGEMSTNELRELVAFCEQDADFNYYAIKAANNELRKRNEKITA